ncbi:Cof-type HAD-IIB family hydrolase [Thermoleptolyngbya sp. C42_A2020_037]|uniref:Cof-type HAD-IIB family hydrolase n=1 Tax=Thermoleptolyngbya sp. C42_A2020_037 TaxID=2747799 RepID=UPI001A0F7043|nr:Cof-type HAD-IIB family hydrolase [Thermoleptolyngbya sp. C42_A2020_037]MBF2086144.1 HAD family phosphatase [Thermoleptolyngbya sp. C42_A2020_037]
MGNLAAGAAQGAFVENSTAQAGEIRLLVVDLDGTVVGASNQISARVKQAVQAVQAQGIPVAIATGRMYQSARRFHADLGSTLPLMSYQGALIKDPADDTLHRHWHLPRVYAQQLLEFYEQPSVRKEVSVHFYINDQLYVREITAETEAYAERSSIEPIAVGDLRTLLDADLTKILAQSSNVELIDDLLEKLRQRYAPTELYLTKSVDIFLEATHPEVNKGNAVRYLAETILGLRANQVMAIGDNFNDFEMLQYAGIGVAMGNAPEGVQAIANWVAPSVEEDGAAIAIEKFILG